MTKSDLKKNIIDALGKSDAYQSMSEAVQKLFMDMLEMLSMSKMREFLALLEDGNRKVESLKNDVYDLEHPPGPEDVLQLKRETDALLKQGKKVVLEIESEDDHKKSEKEAEKILTRIDK